MSDTLFKQVGYTASNLVEFIDLGEIGLPDIQRPFVWKNAKVRDLFDSMYRGYPIGYLLFWQNAFDDGARVIGTDGKPKTPRLLIVDGQQRLTSLFAVFKGIPVVKSDYSKGRIEIAFNPLEEKFEVADAAVRKDPAFLPDIAEVWNGGLFDIVDSYLASLEANREVSDEETKKIKTAITRLHDLKNYPFTALELASTIDEEQVADVFVRINSKGTPLNQADFILTLMSVFWDDGRRELEDFCRRSRIPAKREASPFNHYLEPDPDQLLRVSVGLGFKRARLQYIYSILRGKDLQTGEFSEERRDAQFEVLREAQGRVLDLTYWHDFLKVVRQAGYLGGRQLTSKNNLIFAYILYLMGRTEFKVSEHTLRRAVARYFFMSNLTGRYTGSPESAMEFDLAKFRGVTDPGEFIAIVDRTCDAELTGDFWEITLPNDLATSAAYSPKLFAYYAALCLLDSRGLYSKQKVHDLLDPSVHSKKSAAERHHLFPKGHLATLGVTDTRRTNEIANYALVEWADNIDISDRAPSDYVPGFEAHFTAEELRQMYEWHALPDGWWEMEYDEFLSKRRELMARVIREAFADLDAPVETEGKKDDAIVADLLAEGEGVNVEFKSTLRVNLHTGEKDPRMELAVLRTIAGFLNSRTGGTLCVGVDDSGESVGLEADGFPNEDKLSLHLDNLIRDRIGPQFMMYIHPHFADYCGKRILLVECSPARSAAYVKDGKDERFFVRGGASTSELTMSQAEKYIAGRF
jgi:hypothetical protein